jgi:hypothetical protein
MINAECAKWRKSSKCGSNACVEVAPIDGNIAMRDSKTAGGPILTFTPKTWDEFIAGVRNGDFEQPE